MGLWVTKFLRVLSPVIWTGRVRELQAITETDEALEIGAAVTYADATEQMAALYPDVGELFRRLGGEQVRNVGTIGGNIANGSPIGDSPPALIAAGARIVLRRGDERRELPLESFFIEYGKQDRKPSEFVERIILPKPEAGLRFRAYKVAKRFDQDISAVMGAFALRLEAEKVAHIRIAFGGMAGTPKRAKDAEEAILGQPWNEATLAAALRGAGTRLHAADRLARLGRLPRPDRGQPPAPVPPRDHGRDRRDPPRRPAEPGPCLSGSAAASTARAGTTVPSATSPARPPTSTTCPSPRASCTSISASAPRRTPASGASTSSRCAGRRAWCW